MSSISMQRRPFDSSTNPFLKASNPYKLKQKFYTQASSQQKYYNRSLPRNTYNNDCSHCVKQSNLFEQLNIRQVQLRGQRQNLQKVSAFRSKKNTQNPFEKKSLMTGFRQTHCTQSQQPSFTQYSRNDENNLRRLLENNPFRKYKQEQKENLPVSADVDVQFYDINLSKKPTSRFEQPTSKFHSPSKEQNIRRTSVRHLKGDSGRFSFQSQGSNRLNSIQNSPTKKSKFSPSIIDIGTYRNNRSKNNLEEISKVQKQNCLIRQITLSRKQLFDSNKYGKQEQQKFVESKTPKKSLQKCLSGQSNKSLNEEVPEFIMIKGKKFFINKVQKRYY